MVETNSDKILSDAGEGDVALLVVGDPFGATTHTDILLRARDLDIPTHIVHNASIMSAIGASGLQLYNFGQAVSIPFWTEKWKPDSWLEKILENARIGLHTLVLLDIKVKEQSEENLARGRKIFEPPRYMSPAVALEQILEAVSNSPLVSQTKGFESQQSYHKGPPKVLSPSHTLALTLSRVGTPHQGIKAGTLSDLEKLCEEDFGPPLHSLVIVGSRLHPVEVRYAGKWAIEGGSWERVAREVYGVIDE
ncbi:tetrapyrrole methylase [Cantharellus anzutake]|uniref:tetrapyrrole methylase n=1 Tax=Cantharellus anzutake TaxID=1750568 RepID=UPI0019060A08|nr:tetrapyrrole methylase [Cantharellus anzutake]KAF8324877.1 tetrapyrrole methylase [Cantharellus anzutake]